MKERERERERERDIEKSDNNEGVWCGVGML